MKATILLTGGLGFIGSHICRLLSEKGYRFVVIDKCSAESKEDIFNLSGAKFYKKDISKEDIEEIFKIEKPDFVIHLAAQISVNNSEKNPYEDASINILATIKLLELCKKYNIKKIIAASTAAVYGNSKYLPVDEKHPLEPFSHYGLSKLTMEKYIQLSKVPYIIFRFSNVYGPGQKNNGETGVISLFSQAMENNENIYINGTGEQIRDFIYVEDIANIFLKAIENNVQNEIVNFSCNKGTTINSLFEKMKQVYGYKFEPVYKPEKQCEIKSSILSNEKAFKLFEIKDDLTKLEDGILKLKMFNKNKKPDMNSKKMQTFEGGVLNGYFKNLRYYSNI